MSQPTRTSPTIRLISGPLAAAAAIVKQFPALPAATIEAHPQWGLTIHMHDSCRQDFRRWVDALDLSEAKPRVVDSVDPFLSLSASGLYAEVAVVVRAYVALPVLPERITDAAAEVALLGLWLDVHGDQKKWTQDVQLAHARAVASSRAARRDGAL